MNKISKASKAGKLVAKTVVRSVKLASAIVMLGAAVTFFITKGMLFSIIESENDENKRK